MADPLVGKDVVDVIMGYFLKARVDLVRRQSVGLADLLKGFERPRDRTVFCNLGLEGHADEHRHIDDRCADGVVDLDAIDAHPVGDLEVDCKGCSSTPCSSWPLKGRNWWTKPTREYSWA